MSYSPPQTVQSAARRGLRLLEKTKAGTPVGWARARDLSAGRAVSLEVIGRMVSFFARHGAQRPANVGTDSDPTPWLVAWLLWGGDAGEAWAKSVWRRDGSVEASESAWRDVLAWRETTRKAPPTPEGLVGSRPFRVCSTGTVYDPRTGKSRGSLSPSDLRGLAVSVRHGPVPLDYNHSTAPGEPTEQDPRAGAPMGRVVGAWVEDEGDGRGLGLYVWPGWTRDGAAMVEGMAGAVYPSPEWQRATHYDRGTGKPVGTIRLRAVALTPRPAQTLNRVDPVLWSEKGGSRMELTQEAFDALKAERDALAARVAELEAAGDPGEGSVEMAEGEVAKMREALSAQGAEVVKLREAHTKLIGQLEAERCERDLDRVIGEGRQPEAARKVGRQLWSVRDSIPDAWRAWAEAPASVPKRESAAGAASAAPMTAEQQVKALAGDAPEGSEKWREAARKVLFGGGGVA